MKRFVTAGIVVCLVLAAFFMLRAAGCSKRPPISLFPLVSREDLARGEVLYNNRCRYCHGDPDRGAPPRFAAFAKMGIVKGDPQVLASAILYEKEHMTGPNGPYLFEEMPDADIARVANFIRSRAGAEQVPLRAKTVRRAREIRTAEASGAAPAEKSGETAAPAAPEKPETTPAQPSPTH